MAAWDRDASAWWSFLSSQGRPATEIAVILQDALGPRPGSSDQPDEAPLSSVEVSVSAAPLAPPAQLPPFQWADRVPLPPGASGARHTWPHPLGEAPRVQAAADDEVVPGFGDPLPGAPVEVLAPVAGAPAPKKAARRTRGRTK